MDEHEMYVYWKMFIILPSAQPDLIKKSGIGNYPLQSQSRLFFRLVGVAAALFKFS